MSGERRIGIIGASASGIYTALLLSLKANDCRITLFDRTDKIGKKILATGNGHCNLLHSPFDPDAYNRPSIIRKIYAKVGQDGLQQALESLGIETLTKGELVYPLSYSAASFVRHLGNLLVRQGIDVHLEERVTDVQDKKVITDKGVYEFDAVVFAFGGKSQPNLGSDGSMFDIVERLGYRVIPLEPGLCPLRCPDVPKSLAGVRHSARIRLLSDKGRYEEVGEVLFKKDGVSGICIMNASLFFGKDCSLDIDFFPELSRDELAAKLLSAMERYGDDFLVPFFEKPLCDFYRNHLRIAAEMPLNFKKAQFFAMRMKSFTLHPTARYDFAESQVTIGGVSLAEVDSHFRAFKNLDHYFVGECLDVHGLCGGHNLGFALLSAIVVSEVLA